MGRTKSTGDTQGAGLKSLLEGQGQEQLRRAGTGDVQSQGNSIQTESELGGATDGLRNRINRLRLLGNGVVPMTAAKAFYTLINKLNG